MITHFKDKNYKPRIENKKKYTLTSFLKRFDTFVITFYYAISSSITLSLTRNGLIVIPISTATA